MGKFTKAIFLIISITALVFTAACGNSDKKSGSKDEVKVGVISWLNGSGASYGEAITNGLKLANKEIDKEGKVKLKLITEDSAGKKDQAQSVAEKLINSEKVSAIIGPTLSTEMKAVGPIAQNSGVPIIGTSTTAKGIPQIGDYVFRNSIPEEQAIPASIKAAKEKYKAKNVAILYGNDDVFTQSGYDVMKAEAKKQGLKVTTTEKFQQGQADYKAQLTKIKNTNPDLILCSALYNEGAVIMDQARKLGIDVPIVGGNGFNSPKVIDNAGDAANGLIVATPWFAGKDDAKVKEFVKNYKDAYGKEPDQFAAQAYDALHVLAEAVERAGSDDPDAIRDELAKTKDYKGILGTVSFDKEGDIVMEPNVLIIKDGKFQIFE